MSYTTIPSTWITVGKSWKKEIVDLIKSNADDHEARLIALSVGTGPVLIFDDDITNVSSGLSLNGVFTWKAFAATQVTKVQVQIYTKDGISSGLLEIDVKKASTLGGTYASICTTLAYINYSTDSTYAARDAVLGASTFAINEFLRLDVTSVPTGVISKMRVMIYGVLS